MKACESGQLLLEKAPVQGRRSTTTHENAEPAIRDDIVYGGERKRERHYGIENKHNYNLLM
jgi:hypothetical protein